MILATSLGELEIENKVYSMIHVHKKSFFVFLKVTCAFSFKV
jgi:hypothetical protein